MRAIRLLVLAIATSAAEAQSQGPPAETELVRVTAPTVSRSGDFGLAWEPLAGYVRRFEADTLVLDVTTRSGGLETFSFPAKEIQKVEIHTYQWSGVARPGAPVKVFLRDGRTLDGNVRKSADTLRLTVATADQTISLTAPEVDRLLVRRNGIAEGAVVGGLIGTGAGLLVTLGNTVYCPAATGSGTGPKPRCGPGIGSAMGVGAVAGAAVGALVGSTRNPWRLRERSWYAIPLEGLRLPR